MTTLSLSKFNPKSIENRRVNGSGPATCVFIGKRGTGKSTLVDLIMGLLTSLRKIQEKYKKPKAQKPAPKKVASKPKSALKELVEKVVGKEQAPKKEADKKE